MLQPSQHDLLRGLLDLAGEEYFVEDCVDLRHRISFVRHFTPSQIRKSGTQTHLVEIKHQIQLAYIPKELIQHFDKEMDGFEVSQLIIVLVDTCAEEQAGITAIDYFQVVSEFHEVRLVLLVPWCDEAVDFAFELLLLDVVVGAVPFA